MQRGMFITFEGPDGSGKTTQLKRLATWLESRGHRVVALRQPGSTALGEAIRALLLNSRTELSLGNIAPLAELALMFADRAQAIAEVIEPAVASGAIVLCDRYTDSSEAYQGGGRELGPKRVLAVHEAICQGLQPELTVLLLPDLPLALRRARGRNKRQTERKGTDENRFEREDDAFYQRIHAAYEEIARREPNRVVVFRDDAGIGVIELKIRAAVEMRLAAEG